MKNKKMLSTTFSYTEDTLQARPAWTVKGLRVLLKNYWQYLLGERKPKSLILDPAFEVINQINDTQIRTMVKELHFRTPRSLKAMREVCQECFMLPDDCPYVDYSIFDVKKAVKKINSKAMEHLSKKEVINELANVNNELAYHLREHFDLND